jgi:hypothetical protein
LKALEKLRNAAELPVTKRIAALVWAVIKSIKPACGTWLAFLPHATSCESIARAAIYECGGDR